MDIKVNVADPTTWIKGFFILVFAVIAYALCGIICLIVVVQFFTTLITGDPNTHLTHFSQLLTRYFAEIIRYVTFQSKARPFPFGSFPTDAAATEEDLPTANADQESLPRRKKTPRKKISKKPAGR